MARRVGSASATKTCSAIASASIAPVSGCIEDAVRETHGSLRRVAIERLPYYGNRLVASNSPTEAAATDPFTA